MKPNAIKLRTAAWAIAAPFGLAVVVASCESILDTAPMGELNDQSYYQTTADFANGTLGAYSTLLNYAWEQSGLGLYKGTYMPDDDVRCNTASGWPGGCDEDQFRWTADNQSFALLWRESYKGVMRTNMILQKLPEAKQVPEAEKKRFEGEAKFLRAYFYFFLARHFADPAKPTIPLVTEVAKSLDAAYNSPAPTDKVWDLIESDLAFAAANLPGKARWVQERQVGRATKGAANALLGKVRLYRAQWFNQPAKYKEAITAFEAVVNSGEYSLVPNYQHNFSVDHKNNNESIFEVQSSEGTDINGWDPVDSGYGSASYSRDIAWGPGCYQGSCEPWGGGRSYGLLHVNEGLRSQFDAKDPRAGWTFLKDGDKLYSDPDSWIPNFKASWSITGSTPAKYVKPMRLNTYSQSPTRYHVNDYNNDRLIRYADVLLMLAEAKLLGNNDVAGAAALVNQVRARARAMAGSPPGLLPDVPASGAPAQWHRQHLQKERRLELTLEGHRYDDLVRWHRAGIINIKNDIDFGYADPKNNWGQQHLLKPIPQVELDRNKNLKQNTGY